ncbi:unnamed protein product [Rotaria sp. Silwood2]|nr:unnamed protein product [Rotaria sp. Silwood2]
MFIVSGRLGKVLVPLSHDRSNISSIYVYCTRTEEHKKWIKEIQKVKAITNDLDDLITKIKADHKNT